MFHLKMFLNDGDIVLERKKTNCYIMAFSLIRNVYKTSSITMNDDKS